MFDRNEMYLNNLKRPNSAFLEKIREKSTSSFVKIRELDEFKIKLKFINKEKRKRKQNKRINYIEYVVKSDDVVVGDGGGRGMSVGEEMEWMEREWEWWQREESMEWLKSEFIRDLAKNEKRHLKREPLLKIKEKIVIFIINKF